MTRGPLTQRQDSALRALLDRVGYASALHQLALRADFARALILPDHRHAVIARSEALQIVSTQLTEASWRAERWEKAPKALTDKERSLFRSVNAQPITKFSRAIAGYLEEQGQVAGPDFTDLWMTLGHVRRAHDIAKEYHL